MEAAVHHARLKDIAAILLTGFGESLIYRFYSTAKNADMKMLQQIEE